MNFLEHYFLVESEYEPYFFPPLVYPNTSAAEIYLSLSIAAGTNVEHLPRAKAD